MGDDLLGGNDLGVLYKDAVWVQLEFHDLCIAFSNYIVFYNVNRKLGFKATFYIQMKILSTPLMYIMNIKWTLSPKSSFVREKNV